MAATSRTLDLSKAMLDELTGDCKTPQDVEKLYSQMLQHMINRSLDAEMLPLLQERVTMPGAYPERVAACLYLMDRKDEARSFAEAFLKTERDYFEGFAIPFLKLLTH